jgi:hypothetical protein
LDFLSKGGEEGGGKGTLKICLFEAGEIGKIYLLFLLLPAGIIPSP